MHVFTIDLIIALLGTEVPVSHLRQVSLTQPGQAPCVRLRAQAAQADFIFPCITRVIMDFSSSNTREADYIMIDNEIWTVKLKQHL